MPNIRFVRQADVTSDEWELDCTVLPTDETNGELVHYANKKLVQFVGETEPGLFSQLSNLLDRIIAGEDTPKESIRLVLGRLKEDKRTYYSLCGADAYPPDSPEAEIWKLINAIYDKRMRRSAPPR